MKIYIGNYRKDYYQEGSHIYGELNVLEAFRKALTTWARWVDANVNPMKSMVFFRGYSASHFRYILKTFIFPLFCFTITIKFQVVSSSFNAFKCLKFTKNW